MNPFDDLPQRSRSHDVSEVAENAFRSALQSYEFFVIQREDRKDYGTDVQIEARSGKSMTNIRAHVQLKGTETALNSDGSVSVEIGRTNLNYLLSQADSIYVCYHLPSRRLLVRYAEDAFREYEHRGGKEWKEQANITVRFYHELNENFQSQLQGRLLASGASARNRRVEWNLTPPEKVPELIQHSHFPIEVPNNPMQARKVLSALYDVGHDLAISHSFALFEATLQGIPGAMDLAYMAEINLGINGASFDEPRVRRSIQVLQEAMSRGDKHPGSILYCQGNAHLALGDHQAALSTYKAALLELNCQELSDFAAQCHKNMGTTHLAMGDKDDARACFEHALQLNPDLGEAHYALALWYYREAHSPSEALNHLDQVIRRKGSALQIPSVQGWRITFLFESGNTEDAFREINIIIGSNADVHWIWPWCARHVSRFGKSSADVARKAVRFWRAFLREYPGDVAAEREYLLCQWIIRSDGASAEIDFNTFKSKILQLIESGDQDAAFLWDRIGHWAQYDGNWKQAEYAYRKAYEVDPERYGYCLGTALNILNRQAEALPILLPQAEKYLPDAMSWFQLAVAYEGVGNIEECISGYHRALELDPDYDLAWFNLGGIYWNSLDVGNAVKIWREAIQRYPNHNLSHKLHLDLPQIFGAVSN